MEFTNGRAMELYRKMGLSEGLRKEAVPGHYHFNEIITTGYGDTGDTVTLWVWQTDAEFSRNCSSRRLITISRNESPLTLFARSGRRAMMGPTH